MKSNPHKLFVILILLVITSCGNDNEDTDGMMDPKLNGKWNLISVSCFCEPVNLAKGQQIWYFDTKKSKLTVVNNVTENLHTIFQSGVYDIRINQPESSIVILSTNYSYSVTDTVLHIANSPEVDGPLIKFVRD